MDVNEGSLQVIDREVILENVSVVLLYSAYLPVVALVLVFVIHTISYIICDSMYDE